MSENRAAVTAVQDAYARRAAEYIARLGTLGAMAEADVTTITAWGRRITGHALDAGCGPGHWTDHLRRHGLDITGVDIVPELVASARTAFPGTKFQVGGLETLPYSSGSLAGILAWYSLIHAEPSVLPRLLDELARCLAPGGSLLLGWFVGERVEPFDHAVITAYTWPVEDMCRLLDEAGFDVDSVQERRDVNARPHADMTATLRA